MASVAVGMRSRTAKLSSAPHSDNTDAEFTAEIGHENAKGWERPADKQRSLPYGIARQRPAVNWTRTPQITSWLNLATVCEAKTHVEPNKRDGSGIAE